VATSGYYFWHLYYQLFPQYEQNNLETEENIDSDDDIPAAEGTLEKDFSADRIGLMSLRS
jgi:hypothetical protein